MEVRISPMGRDEIEIEIPMDLQSDEFADEFLKIQRLEKESYKKVVVRFEYVLWIDNLVMIYLFLLLKKLKNVGKSIYFEIKVDPSEIEQVRFVKYLYDYGFLEFMEQLSGENVREKIEDCFEIVGYNDLEKGDFRASECLIPFSLLTKKNEIENFIKEAIKRFHNTVQNEIAESERIDLEFKMSLFFQEVLGNVFEHAYDGEDNAGCGVMVRYIHQPEECHQSKKRQYYNLSNLKGVNRFFKNASFTFQNHQQLAAANPYRNKNGMATLENYLQIFVADVGKGILQSMGVKDRKEERKLINDVFEKGSSIRRKSTEVGGLRMLYNLFGETGNYISVKGEYNWASIFCGNSRDIKDALPYVHRNKENEVLKGFAIVGYMDCHHESKGKFLSLSKEMLKKAYTSSHNISRIEELANTEVVDLRFEEWKHNKNACKNIICFVEKNLEKGVLINKIVKDLEEKDENSDRKVLILVDIPEREKKKYELIFEKMSGKVGNVILVTQGLKCAIYSKGKEKKLEFKRKKTEDYLESDKNDITKSLYHLLRIIRYYESCKFWEGVAYEQTKNGKPLFINEEVGWVNGEKMVGYLDFSQICFTETLKDRLIYQLQRIAGFSGENKYFCSMDRFAEELCDIVNGKLRTSYDPQNCIQLKIGSVYVTGTLSRKSTLKSEGNATDEYYYFVRAKNKEEGKKIPSLLLWPENSVTKELFGAEKEEKHFRRVGRTPFVAVDGNEYFMRKHYENVETSVYMKPADTYDFLQKDKIWAERLGKIAHYDMIEHHDCIHLNITSAFRKNQMESGSVPHYISQNCFDYLLKDMYKALGKSTNIKDDITPKYVNVVEGKIDRNEISATPGVFVYLTDYETLTIVFELKKIFSEKVNQRIIPIAPISKKRGASALLMSPILMESIQKKLKDIGETYSTEEKRVTIFVATLISAKLQRELKHILYRLGATEVKSLSIIDRQRLPLGSRKKKTFSSFSKWDLPELGTEDNCKLCLGIQKVEELSKLLLTSDMKKRCEKINSIWRKVKAPESSQGRGVSVQYISIPSEIEEEIFNICEKYRLKNEVKVITDIGLALFAVENTVVTMSIDFLKKCLKVELQANVKILLIAVHLLLFGEEEIVEIERYDLAKILYELLQQQMESNEYTALACVVLLAEKNRIQCELHRYYQKSWKTEYFKNIDFIIASIGVMRAESKEWRNKELSYWLQEENEEKLDYLYGIFILTDGRTKTRHGTILSKLKSVDEEFSSLEYLSALNDVQFLEKAYECMPHSYFAEPKFYLENQKQVHDKLERIGVILKEGIDGKLDRNRRRDLTNAIREMMESASKFNEKLFMRTEKDLTKLRKELAELAKTTVGDKCYVRYIDYDGKYGEKYFCFLEDLRREISYLMMDFRYANKQDLIEGDDGNDYWGVVEVKIEEDYMKYRFINHVDESFDLEKLKRRKKLKFNRPSILSLRMMMPKEYKDKIFEFLYDKDKKEYVAEICMPYLETYKRGE